MTFGERLTQLRKEAGYSTRNEFAEKLGIPGTTLRNYETNVREPGHTFLKQMSEMFNVSVDYLLCLTDEKEKISSYQLKSNEYEHIKKYRQLDEHSRDIVDTIINMELERKPAIQEVREDNIIRLPFSDCKASAGTGSFLFDSFPEDTIDVVLNSVTEKASECIAVEGDSMQPLYYDGDILLVKRQQYIDVGEIGIFIKGGEGYVKKKGEDRLISLNKEYKDIYPDDEVITCYGKVIGKVEDDWRR